MRRLIVLGAAVSALVVLPLTTASATHSGGDPAGVAIYEGAGSVCAITGDACSYYIDAIWAARRAADTGDLGWLSQIGNATPPPAGQGVYGPGLGPPASEGGWSFTAGPATAPGANGTFCVDSYGGDGCAITGSGTFAPATGSGLGVYCGASRGGGATLYTSSNLLGTKPTYQVSSTISWVHSGATILPITGTATSASFTGTATVIAFSSARGAGGATGNCNGLTATAPPAPTTSFQVEGMSVTF